ncbi:hypothetical protein VULLAG_LOCUS6217 [Vulpes lagopus]
MASSTKLGTRLSYGCQNASRWSISLRAARLAGPGFHAEMGRVGGNGVQLGPLPVGEAAFTNRHSPRKLSRPVFEGGTHAGRVICWLQFVSKGSYMWLVRLDGAGTSEL